MSSYALISKLLKIIWKEILMKFSITQRSWNVSKIPIVKKHTERALGSTKNRQKIMKQCFVDMRK